MWNVKNVSFENLFSHTDTSIDFQENLVYPIIGKNISDEGQDSNGSGKSVLIEAFLIGLIGKSLRKKSIKDCIMWGCKEANITIELYNSSIKQSLKIERTIFSKKTPKVLLYQNDELRKDLADISPKDTDKEILRILDISEEDILSYYIINKENYVSFFSSTDGAKKKIINRFSNINIIDESLDKLKLDISDKKEDINNIEIAINSINTKISMREDDIYNLENKRDPNEVEKEREEKINNEIKELENTSKNYENALSQLNLSLEKAKKDLNKIDLKKAEENIKLINDSISDNKNNKVSYEEKVEKFKQAKSKLEVYLSGQIQCPHCKHVFTTQTKMPINKIKENIKKGEEAINSTSSLIKNIDDSIISLKNDIKNYESVKDLFNDSKQKVLDIQHKINVGNNKLNSINSKILQKQEALNNSENIKDNSLQIKEFKEHIKELNKDLQEKNNLLQKKNSDLENHELWLNYYKSFKNYLIVQCLNSIEGFVNYYLSLMKTDLSVKIDGFKENIRTGKISEQISVKILRDGEEKDEYSSFSQGERGRIDVACILALQHLINMNANGGGLNQLLIDEILDSVDELGISLIINSLQNVDRTIGMITHVKKCGFNNELAFLKENGKSRLLNEKEKLNYWS